MRYCIFSQAFLVRISLIRTFNSWFPEFQKQMDLILLQSLSLVEAEKIALSILKQVMEEKLTSSNVEVVAISPTRDGKGFFFPKFFLFNMICSVL